MNNTETINMNEIPNISMNNLPKEDFVDIFFDDSADVLTDENIIKPIETNETPEILDSDEEIKFSEIFEDEKPFETPFTGENNEPILDTKEFSIGNEKKDSIIFEDNQVPEIEDIEVGNFDSFINNLAENVIGANKYIAEVMEIKRNMETKELELMNLKEKISNQEQEFREYLKEQQSVLEASRKQIDDYMQGEKLRLESEIAQFKTEADTTRAELMLLEENLKMKQEKFSKEKEQFENHVKVENGIIEAEYKKLDDSKKQIEKEKELAQETINNQQKEFENKKEEFERYKEFEERKIELESKNLAKSCARFKQIVSQLNSGFSQLQDKE